MLCSSDFSSFGVTALTVSDARPHTQKYSSLHIDICLDNIKTLSYFEWKPEGIVRHYDVSDSLDKACTDLIKLSFDGR